MQHRDNCTYVIVCKFYHVLMVCQPMFQNAIALVATVVILMFDRYLSNWLCNLKTTQVYTRYVLQQSKHAHAKYAWSSKDVGKF